MQKQDRAKNEAEATSLRAAQYLRVSTGQQKYSIENQAAALAAYAARRNISIVRTYSDKRSGVRIVGRDGLQQLIKDVQRAGADFDCILVYDVSRWGRFQDIDESAYYEFICTRAGKIVHYCADEFENDGSLTSVIVKNVKRVGAADFSRQLSKKVFLGQCRVATLGRWRGGPAGYGLRRRLVSEHGKPKMLLKFGQRKNLKTEYCVLALGPESEVRIVRQIFDSFANKGKTRTEIANELNARGIRNSVRKLWSMQTIDNILKNEVYLGNIVYNRRSQKIGERAVENPSDMWIRCNNALEPIISSKLFAKAQKVLLELRSGRTRTDKELLDQLVTLLRKKGHLSIKLMQAAKLPHWTAYAKRFGSLNNAYKRIGFQPSNRYRFAEIFASIDGVVRSVAKEISIGLGRRRSNVTFLPELYLLTINRGLTVGMAVARSISNGSGDKPSRRWEIRKLKYRRSDLTLVIRMETSNTKIKDYYLIPTANLPPVRENRTRISDRHFGEFGHDNLNGVLRGIIDWSASSKSID